MQLFRIIYALFLMVLITLPTWYALQLNVRQVFVRIEMENKLEQELTQTIRVGKNSVQWIVGEKEVSINQKLFDVSRWRIDGEFIELTGLYDEKEFNILKEIEQKENNEEGNILASLLHFTFSHQDPVLSLPEKPIFPIQLYTRYSASLFNTDLNLLTPPPKI